MNDEDRQEQQVVDHEQVQEGEVLAALGVVLVLREELIAHVEVVRLVLGVGRESRQLLLVEHVRVVEAIERLESDVHAFGYAFVSATAAMFVVRFEVSTLELHRPLGLVHDAVGGHGHAKANDHWRADYDEEEEVEPPNVALVDVVALRLRLVVLDLAVVGEHGYERDEYADEPDDADDGVYDVKARLAYHSIAVVELETHGERVRVPHRVFVLDVALDVERQEAQECHSDEESGEEELHKAARRTQRVRVVHRVAGGHDHQECDEQVERYQVREEIVGLVQVVEAAHLEQRDEKGEVDAEAEEPNESARYH